MSDDKIIDIASRKPFKVGEAKSLNFSDITNDDLSGGNWSAEINAFLESQNLKNLFFSED